MATTHRSVPLDGPTGMDPDVVAAIDARLAGVAADHGVTVPWAIESGSRAWGFPSPDSDYDCRFVFVRPRADYLSPWRPRDVIETPFDPVLDVNGWDLVKAVQLAVRGNAVVGEWLRSPIVYGGDPAFAAALTDLLRVSGDRAATARHYLHVGRNQWDPTRTAEGQPVRLKKVLYATRSVLALRWLELHDGVPPMQLDELLAETDPPPAVREVLADVVARKAVTRELGEAPVPAPLAAYVAGIVSRTPDPVLPTVPRDDVRREASARFVAMVDRWAP